MVQKRISLSTLFPHILAEYFIDLRVFVCYVHFFAVHGVLRHYESSAIFAVVRHWFVYFSLQFFFLLLEKRKVPQDANPGLAGLVGLVTKCIVHISIIIYDKMYCGRTWVDVYDSHGRMGWLCNHGWYCLFFFSSIIFVGGLIWIYRFLFCLRNLWLIGF